jgi:hypothetical protein
MWIVFFTWPLLIGVLIELAHALTGANKREVAPYIGIPVFALVFLSLATFHFACPRCGGNFYRKGSYRNAFSDRCLHCGIRVGTAMGVEAHDDSAVDRVDDRRV